MKLKTCTNCGEFFYKSDHHCPHCSIDIKDDTSSIPSYNRFTKSALLLGLVLTACGDKPEDTAADTASEPTAEPTSEPTSEPAIENDYGVPDTGNSEE